MRFITDAFDAASLIFGNTIGISLFSWIFVKLKLSSLPQHTDFAQLISVAVIGGVGFTMSLFITNLAFENQAMIDASKIGILIGSLISGIAGYYLLKLTSVRSGRRISTEEVTGNER